jgi:hypothetical protein
VVTTIYLLAGLACTLFGLLAVGFEIDRLKKRVSDLERDNYTRRRA